MRLIKSTISKSIKNASSFGLLLALTGCLAAHPNELAVGHLARVQERTAIEVPLNNPVCLNGASQAQILWQRASIVQKTAQLLAHSYNPDPAIFGQIVDGKPWWGMEGIFVFGSGQRSIEGASEEARFIVNPYLLVAANSWSAEIWDTNKIGAKELSDKSFPFCFKPSYLRFYPREKAVKVLYDITEFHSKLATFDYCRKEKNNISDFGLVAYNARDFGYRYIFFDPEKSVNVTNENPTAKAIEIRQFIHCGGSCGLESGCNNMSPAQDEIDHLKLKALPATALVKLWKSEPESTKTPADMHVYLEFR